MKKYNLRIPTTILREDALLAVQLRSYIVVYDSHNDFDFIPKDWVEEVSEESAFQKWNKNTQSIMDPIANSIFKENHDRKSGWNAAINAILDTPCESANYMGQLISKETMREMKEP